MAPSTKNEKKNPSLLPMTFINMFERNYGTFRKRGGKPNVVNDIGPVCPPKKVKNKQKKTFI